MSFGPFRFGSPAQKHYLELYMTQRKRIAFIFAMAAEAAPLIQSLGLSRVEGWGDPRLPFLHYIGTYENDFDLVISTNGKDPRWGVDNIGTDPAVLNAYLTLTQFKPDLCINCGTAGAFKKNQAQVGDVYLSSEAIRYHDRRIAIQGYDIYGVGHFPVLPLDKMAHALGLKLGVVSTGNSLDFTAKDLEMIEQNNGSIKEMEAAAIAYVAHLLGVPFFAVKAVTDLVDSELPPGPEFLKNLEMACAQLFMKTQAVLAYLASHPSEWQLQPVNNR